MASYGSSTGSGGVSIGGGGGATGNKTVAPTGPRQPKIGGPPVLVGGAGRPQPTTSGGRVIGPRIIDHEAPGSIDSWRSGWKAIGHSVRYRGSGDYLPIKGGGVTPKAATKGPPAPFNWLAPQNPADLQKQATATITASYAPGFQQLDSQGARAQAISDKRTSDNKYYQNWLDMNMAALQSHQDASHAALVQQQQQDNQMIQAAQATQKWTQTAQGNPTGAGATAALTQAGNTHSALALGGSESQALQRADTGQSLLGATAANNFAYVQAGQTKQLSDLNTTLTNIANQRAKLIGSEHGDIAKEVARLSGVEVSKAQSARDFTLAQGTLANKVAVAKETQVRDYLASVDRNRAISVTLNGQKITMRGQDINARLKTIDQQLAQGNLDEKTRHDISSEKVALQNAIAHTASSDAALQNAATGRGKLGVAQQNANTNAYKATHPSTRGGGSGAGSPAAANKLFSEIDQKHSLYGTLQSLGYGRGDIYRLMSSGGQYRVQTGKNKNGPTYRYISIKPSSTPIVNAAMDLAEKNGLTGGSVNWLHSQGVNNNGRYPLYSAPSTGRPNTVGGT